MLKADSHTFSQIHQLVQIFIADVSSGRGIYCLLTNRLLAASSIAQGKFLLLPGHSIESRTRESISSTKMMDGASAFAIANSARTSFSLSPRYLLVKLLAEIAKNVLLLSVATALANMVFPIRPQEWIDDCFFQRTLCDLQTCNVIPMYLVTLNHNLIEDLFRGCLIYATGQLILRLRRRFRMFVDRLDNGRRSVLFHSSPDETFLSSSCCRAFAALTTPTAFLGIGGIVDEARFSRSFKVLGGLAFGGFLYLLGCAGRYSLRYDGKLTGSILRTGDCFRALVVLAVKVGFGRVRSCWRMLEMVVRGSTKNDQDVVDVAIQSEVRLKRMAGRSNLMDWVVVRAFEKVLAVLEKNENWMDGAQLEEQKQWIPNSGRARGAVQMSVRLFQTTNTRISLSDAPRLSSGFRSSSRLPETRKVLNMPPLFSGLGVREPFRWPVDDWGASMDDDDDGVKAELVCKGDLRTVGTSVPELYFELTGGMLPPPRPPALLWSALSWSGMLVLDAVAFACVSASAASSRLCRSASSRSTRSLHCNSICRNDSCRAFSVSERGRHPSFSLVVLAHYAGFPRPNIVSTTVSSLHAKLEEQ
ncbi:hypothetical protein KCU61_g608, partial [Aureobasidium melanogenum]